MTATNETKRKRVNIIRDVTWDMCAAMPNVDVSGLLPPQETKAVQVAMDILYNAAIENRNWTFKVRSLSHITILAGDEELAKIVRSYSSRARMNIPHLYAERLPSTKRNSGVFGSKDAAPILRKIREVVYPKTNEERIAEVTRHVYSRLGSLQYAAMRTIDTTKKALSDAAVAFALDPSMRAQFMHYEATIGAAMRRDTAKAMRDHEQAEADKAMMSRMQNASGKEYPLVARTDAGWYVKHKGVVQQYADDALPHEYTNVHILKLTEPDTLLPDIGIKIDEKTFVIVPIENS